MSLVNHFPVKEEKEEEQLSPELEKRANITSGLYHDLEKHQEKCKFNESVFWNLWEKGGTCPVCGVKVEK